MSLQTETLIKPKAPPCGICGKAKASRIWGVDLCQECTSDWDLSAPMPATLAASLGVNVMTHEVETATYIALTAKWATERRQKLKSTRVPS